MTNASVTSADGTMICYERRGNGDPVIVVNTVAEDRYMLPSDGTRSHRRVGTPILSDQLRR